MTGIILPAADHSMWIREHSVTDAKKHQKKSGAGDVVQPVATYWQEKEQLTVRLITDFQTMLQMLLWRVYVTFLFDFVC